MKVIIYQILTRLWGNSTVHLVPDGDKKTNGCGTMADFTPFALQKIKQLGVTHIWFTGLLEHATATDYSSYGIRRDHTAMVKGKAGSPYAIKDYYDIDPDLSCHPENRMKDFEALVERTHKEGLGFIMDFVPNHVAREYHSDNKPEGVRDLGEDDCREQAFSPANNFYYIPGQPLQCQFDMKGSEVVPYEEIPARATGNDCFSARPTRNDWYETVKLNYGIDYLAGRQKRFTPRPDTWQKMVDILLFWASKGIDGFRCDMAEMVPCEFWDWAIKTVKHQYPHLLFIGEVYQPEQYRDYLYRGHFDYLYDKVGLYETLRRVTCGECPSSDITFCWQNVSDIQTHMLNFIENHDEQRLASDFFACDGSKGRAALIVAATMNVNPMMIYFGQEFGERGMDQEGFSGRDGRTTIFDYWSVQTIRTWRNGGKFQLTNLPKENRQLYMFYKKVLNFALKEPALNEGLFFDLMYANYSNPYFRSDKLFAYIRKKDNEAIFIIANFSDEHQVASTLVPSHAFDYLKLHEGTFKAKELITAHSQTITLEKDQAFRAEIPAWGAALLKIVL